ncbi:hypothetical protein ACH4ZX_12320 [Streptomyces sp. NPDC020490]|uniref:hypothetical protein n=1 Tax=Streptomyces sp. NPDC020490 TaxID=3365078 RepID=UPI0037ADD370
MSPAKSNAPKDTDAPKKQRVFPADFEEFVTATAAGLGDGWTVDTDNKPNPGVSAYLVHPDGRRIGIKHIWKGAAVQTWALDVPPRTFDNEVDAEAHAWSVKQLTPGVRYNVGVCFTNNPPAATTARNIRTRLLPAFDGKRPPLRAFPKKRSRRVPAMERDTAATGLTETNKGEQAATEPEPQKTAAPAKPARRTAKKAQPVGSEAESKKPPTMPRPRRSTALHGSGHEGQEGAGRQTAAASSDRHQHR